MILFKYSKDTNTQITFILFRGYVQGGLFKKDLFSETTSRTKKS